MEVTFLRSAARRYGVQVRGVRSTMVEMNPAPGYDDHLPHDLVHFVVEDELGLALGVFGQLAAGGDAGTFRLPAATTNPRERTREQRRLKKRGEQLARDGRLDAELSEKAAAICHHEWLARSSAPGRRSEAPVGSIYSKRLRSGLSETEKARLSEAAIDRICERLTLLSERWSKLAVGESLVLHWDPSDKVKETRLGRRKRHRAGEDL